MENAKLMFNNIDEYLGKAEQRFFGAGFRRATYSFGEVELSPIEPADVDVKLSITVQYPKDWSKKKDNVDLRPHLSTVDTLVIGAQIAELQMINAFVLDELQRSMMWIRRIAIIAGKKPQEDLIDIPTIGRLIETRQATDIPDAFISLVECKVGMMQANYEIVHYSEERRTQKSAKVSLDLMLGFGKSRYYGDGFKFRQQRVEKAVFDMESLSAVAEVRIEQIKNHSLSKGIESYYPIAMTMVDAFVVQLQMAQILLYELDHVKRCDSNTLWMIRTVLETSTPYRIDTNTEHKNSYKAEVNLVGKRMLKMRNAQWRNIDISGSLGGINMLASFAHEMPAMDSLASRG